MVSSGWIMRWATCTSSAKLRSTSWVSQVCVLGHRGCWCWLHVLVHVLVGVLRMAASRQRVDECRLKGVAALWRCDGRDSCAWGAGFCRKFGQRLMLPSSVRSCCQVLLRAAPVVVGSAGDRPVGWEVRSVGATSHIAGSTVSWLRTVCGSCMMGRRELGSPPCSGV